MCRNALDALHLQATGPSSSSPLERQTSRIIKTIIIIISKTESPAANRSRRECQESLFPSLSNSLSRRRRFDRDFPSLPICLTYRRRMAIRPRPTRLTQHGFPPLRRRQLGGDRSSLTWRRSRLRQALLYTATSNVQRSAQRFRSVSESVSLALLHGTPSARKAQRNRGDCALAISRPKEKKKKPTRSLFDKGDSFVFFRRRPAFSPNCNQIASYS